MAARSAHRAGLGGCAAARGRTNPVSQSGHCNHVRVGAEPVDPATLSAFSQRFAAYGLSATALYPVYGLAEATLAVAVPRPGAPIHCDSVDRRRLAADGVAVPAAATDGVTFVSVGHPLPAHRIAIVAVESGEPVGERRVGELVVEGASVTPGYFGEGSRTTRGRLRTGDLAYIADGHVYIVDRIKDLVIVAGQNYAPSDIESAAAEVSGVRRGRIVAFSAPGTMGSEELHVVAEASPRSWRAPAELADEVRRAIRQEIGLSAATVTIVAPGTLERTSSGKVKRRACAEAHRTGRLTIARKRDRLLHRARRAARLVFAAVRTVVPRRAQRDGGAAS